MLTYTISLIVLHTNDGIFTGAIAERSIEPSQ